MPIRRGIAKSKDIKMKIRNIEETDISDLQHVAIATDLFPPNMLPDLVEPVLKEPNGPHHFLTALEGSRPVGLCYAVPEALTDRTWNMLALAVHPQFQRRGFGRSLVRGMEQALASRGIRLLIVDTSGSQDFTGTREFNKDLGYANEARIRNFWAEGDDKIIFTKALG